MTTKNPTIDQKVDLLISQFSVFGKKLDQFGVKQDKMQKDITDLIELTSSAMNLAAVTSDKVDRLENKKSPASTKPSLGGFTHFTSGAFVA